MRGSEWKDPGRAESWPSYREGLPQISAAEDLLFDHLIAAPVTRVLDLGTGDGHLLAGVARVCPDAAAVGLDLSPAMVDAARQRFAGTEGFEFEVHDLMDPLPAGTGEFDLILSGLAIHHLPDDRKRALFAEAFGLLGAGGAFYNLDCVASPTPELSAISGRGLGLDRRDPDPSDQLAPLGDQLEWLREAGFIRVDCHWKWLELCLFGGICPD
jgi:tRNA (cmo5U34)-methyltransferase